MSEELGKIEKPLAEGFKKGRKLCFIPLIYCGKESPAEYVEKYNTYWSQVENQMGDLESKLGKVDRVYHELITVAGEEGSEEIKELNDKCYEIVKARLGKGAQLESLEDSELLSEFLDWSRCLAIGLQNQKVFTTVYESYVEANKHPPSKLGGIAGKGMNETTPPCDSSPQQAGGYSRWNFYKKRDEHIASRMDETLKADEIGILLMREGHQVQFPPDVQVFYVAPPALDEIKRWLRDREAKPKEG